MSSNPRRVLIHFLDEAAGIPPYMCTGHTVRLGAVQWHLKIYAFKFRALVSNLLGYGCYRTRSWGGALTVVTAGRCRQWTLICHICTFALEEKCTFLIGKDLFSRSGNGPDDSACSNPDQHTIWLFY